MTNKQDIIHENEHYKVVVSVNLDWLDENGNNYEVNYCVVNKTTDIVELYCPMLPSVMFAAEQFNSVLVDKPYMWHDTRKAGEVIESDTPQH